MSTLKLLNSILTKKAKGYSVKEKTDEYVVVDGQLTLVKRKIVTKNVPPDISAVKALIEMDNQSDKVESLTDEQLQQEKLRLLNVLKLCQDEVDEIKFKENKND
ncbi:MAG: hypothetical protein IKC47_02275 [Clostridia bacterium]|nr:hypothetical protein [Clostridia bacterium]